MEITDHGAEATRHLQAFLGEHYHYSEKPVFKALWDNYNDCQFVEDEGPCSPIARACDVCSNLCVD